MKPRKADETDAQYIARLESQNRSLREHNQRLTNWASDISECVTILATEASLVFQAMAEKARVRSHPSVTKAVEMFDSISHPQWLKEAKHFPIEEWPEKWDFDGEDAWSGDADMDLNSAILAVMEYLEGRRFNASGKEARHLNKLASDLQSVLYSRVEGVKEAAGFRPRQLTVPTADLQDLTPDELREVINAMGWMALDIAQDLHFANHMLRRDLRASAYRRACADCYALSEYGYRERHPTIDIKVMGDVQPF